MSRHAYECRVRFSDVDIYRHVNNVKYFEYYQEARIAFVREAGGAVGADDPKVVVARMAVDYRRPILFRTEPYVIESWISRIGRSSYDISAEIKDGDTLLSRATATMVAFDLETQRPRSLSDTERTWMLRAQDEPPVSQGPL